MASGIPAPMTSPTKIWHQKPYPDIDPSRPELSLVGKTAIVTGAGGTIGAAIAKALAKAGIKYLALLGRNKESLTATQSLIDETYSSTTRVGIYPTDIASATEVQETLKKIRADLGGDGVMLDILVNNAGFISQPSPVEAAEKDQWWKSFTINVFGVFNMTQEFIKYSGADPAKTTIININSGMAHVPPTPGTSAYAASKAGAAKLSEYIHAEKPQLRIFDVQPGMVISDINRVSGFQPGPLEDHPDLPGWFCVWLCSDEASFLNGKFVWANWDVNELKEMVPKVKSTQLFNITLNGVPFEWPTM